MVSNAPLQPIPLHNPKALLQLKRPQLRRPQQKRKNNSVIAHKTGGRVDNLSRRFIFFRARSFYCRIDGQGEVVLVSPFVATVGTMVEHCIAVFEAVEPAVFAEDRTAEKCISPTEALPFGMEFGAAAAGAAQWLGIVIGIRTTEK